MKVLLQLSGEVAASVAFVGAPGLFGFFRAQPEAPPGPGRTGSTTQLIRVPEWIIEIIEGDTLSGIAAYFTGDSCRYKDIQRYNKIPDKMIKKLHPGDKIAIPISWILIP